MPRHALSWLLTAQLLVILPFVAYLPAWLVLLWLGCAAWRVQVYRMRVPLPPSWLKGLLLLAVLLGLALSSSGFDLNAAAALLVAAFILKVLEMHRRRDALVVVFLGFFVLVTGFLFDSGLLATLYSLVPFVALLAALIGLQESELARRPVRTLRLAGTLLLQALPLLLVLFVLFPRLGPLWSLPQVKQQGVSGLSDRMAPGDIVELSQSSALAFRVGFDGAAPPRTELYWRALTLERFDGREWSQDAAPAWPSAPQWQAQGEPLRYSVVMEPSNRTWLYGLDVAQTELPRVRQGADFRLEHWRPVDQPLLYPVTSWPAAVRELTAPAATLQRALQLPDAGNPQARLWARQLRADHDQPQALVQAMLSHFREQPYVYSLRPPPVGVHIIDDFLFASRKGFCLHYAGAMTFVLRAAGIPARLVVGYQGGEYNPSGNYLTVRQFDAHAWVEYWLPELGWQRVDPTFAVAPERIEQGLEQAVDEEQSFLADAPLNLLRYRDISWLNGLRLGWERINYGWQRWVLGYQADQQWRVLKEWFGILDGRALVGALLLLLGAPLLLLTVWLIAPWRRRADPLSRQYARFEALLARHGLRRAIGEGPRDFAERSAQALAAQREPILAFARLYEQARYADQSQSGHALRAALTRLRRCLR
ncbi:DUF3488 and DUF4129 domain-containing transglutaminase family protein [Pseudomonas flexibilis]|uniref:Transglutaminase n=1 Tax=Pseudomonas flexibilis TaxID=706570 RepID=A0A0B3BTB9_9PSED|nr:DUF3488 and transglutaminase-like domain-containing protein [Pseudomonas flexibilis]KHO65890.1 transglutaminase [Pseudomonas flexibilis]SCX75436.1 Transglutaminase-like enzyme, putative cysteine protease [Pseudomonas flexibilis]